MAEDSTLYYYKDFQQAIVDLSTRVGDYTVLVVINLVEIYFQSVIFVKRCICETRFASYTGSNDDWHLIQLKTVLLSDHLADRTAAHNSNFGIVSTFKGASFVFDCIRLTCTVPPSAIALIYKAAAKANFDASQNECNSMDAVKRQLYHRGSFE
ncbi:hypothetical protein FF38_01105 [Lucilia cuprina]|uniref:Uncharacterized protein n=1 Tax=Lucilia cuprina TaxID=7375 RepID=A0A0L0CGG2_LUCCU|nr:hypothetical protein FF38_01105 [Lucilia cuprina]